MVKATTAAIIGIVVFFCTGSNGSNIIEEVSAQPSSDSVQVVVEESFAVVVEDAKLFIFDAAGNKIAQ